MSPVLRVLVTGDRHWTDQRMVYRVLDTLQAAMTDETFVVVIHGAAAGADRFAGEWAADRKAHGRNVDYEEYPAHWRHSKLCPEGCQIPVYGNAAGPIRNTQMLRAGRPDLVIAFHDALSASKGTANMVKQAQKAGLDVWFMSHADRTYEGGPDYAGLFSGVGD